MRDPGSPSAPRPAVDVEAEVEVDVLVVGAGPAGLMLACELGLAADRRPGAGPIRVAVLDRLPEPVPFARGFTLNARSLELLDRRGLADRFLAEGPTVPTTAFVGAARLDLATMRTAHPYVLGIPQTRVEEILAERAAELGVPVLRSHRLTGLRQHADAVHAEVATADGTRRFRAARLVGCDGGRSTVRTLAGIAFPGTPPRRFTLLGDVVLADPAALPFGVTAGPGGTVFAIPRPGYVRLLTADPDGGAPRDEPVTPERFGAALERALGRRVEIAEARWLSRFGDGARLAERLRAGRVLLAGDAAHVHPPAGAIGVNAALDDAVNLGWKLALVAQGLAPDALLETYHEERHAAGVRLLDATRAQALLASGGGELAPVRALLESLAAADGVAGPLAELITGVGTRYPVRGGAADHPWSGRMVPDVGGLVGLLARTAGGVLLSTTGDPTPLHGWTDRVTALRADVPTPLLVRPDGHAAWASAPAPDDLPAALEHWFGPRR